MDYGVLAIMPIALCFILIFTSKNAYVAISCGIVSGLGIILYKENVFILLEAIESVFSNISTIKTIVFILIVGALTNALDKSGGVNGLISYLDKKKINTNSKILTQLFAMLIGILLFIDASSSMAVTSVVGKPLFKRANLSAEKLALITNSTAAPIAWIIPFGGASALLSALLSSLDGINEPFQYVLQAIPFQFYTISLLIFLLISIVFNFEIGGIKKAKQEINMESSIIYEDAKARNMVIPVLVLLGSIFTILFVTGKGNILQGDTSNAVFYGGLIALAVSALLYKVQNTANFIQIGTWYVNGIRSMFMITMLLFMAFIFSFLLTRIGTATYIMGVFHYVPIEFLPLMTFLIASLIAFSTGTSGGTVSILVAFVVPIAIAYDISIPIVVGAIVSGAVFGDQNSIISDSVIMTSSMTQVDAFQHVKTQMPYTLVAFLISAILYLIV